MSRSRFRAEQVQPSDEGPVWITLPLPDAYSERNLIFREVADQIRGGPWMIGRGRIMPTSPVSSLIEHICRAMPPYER